MEPGETIRISKKITDVVHVREKDMEGILYINKQAKTMARQSDIVFFCHLLKLFLD